MANYAIVTDLNRCVGCLACTVACKTVNEMEPGKFWIRAVRVGPTLKEGGSWPKDVEMYFIPMQCQHCENPECVAVCPTGASHVDEDGTVQVDTEACIGCKACIAACPYDVRRLDEALGVVDKCTLCQDRVSEGLLPQCVSQCQARARFFGDLDEGGIGTFEAPAEPAPDLDASYETCRDARVTLDEYVQPYTDDDVHYLDDAGNKPKFAYILRNRTWHGEVKMPDPTSTYNVAQLDE